MEGWIGSLNGFFDGYTFHKGPVSVKISNQKIEKIVYKTVKDPNLNGKGHLLFPHFADGHTHLAFAGTRFNELDLKLSGHSYSDILERGGGIQSTVRATRSATDQKLTKLVKSRLDTMLSYGSMIVEVKSGYGLTIEEELRLLRILNEVNQTHLVKVVPTFGAAHVFPQDKSREKYMEEILDEMLPVVVKDNLATSTDVFCDRGAFTIEETLEIFDRSTSFGLPVRVHAEELEYRGIAKVAAKKYPLLSADHLLYATQEDFNVLAMSNTVAMFMPLAPFGLFSDQLPSGYLASNAVIGLGSDFNPNNWAISLQSAIRMAVFRYRLRPVEAIKASTYGSYLGITGNEMERIGEGSTASFNLINASSIESFVSKFGQNLVSHVFLNGGIVWKNNARIS